MNRRRFWPAIVNRHAQEEVVRRGLGVFHEDIEVAVVVKDAGVENFKFRFRAPALRALLDELRVGKFPLRILVEHLEIRVRGRGVEVVIKFLHVLAVIALGVGEAKKSFLENRVLAIPQRDGKAEVLQAVANARDAVLAPAVGATASVVVRKIFPRRAAGRIIFAHGSPLALGQVRPEKLPRLHAVLLLVEADFFSDGWHKA